ncbi:hypothetical protein LCGC14_2891000 [marine sediment metagenome]|uniref:Uncharacterized protein n=1 Tax=marine sediment metagenome TaxID=412755 RepID=A0A0F8XXJ3_9ZZZZ
MKSAYVNVKLGGMKSIITKGEHYEWNSVYKTYNSRRQNDLLRWLDLGITEAATS